MTRFGPYQLIRRLGSGATAEVFLARGPNPANAELLALKLILPHLADDGGHRSMLLREARAVAPLRHPNVVQLYEVGEHAGRTFLAMEYVPGFALNTLLRAVREKGDRMSLAEAAHVIREAALGLHHAHEARAEDGTLLGLIHRDVSPHNLMVAGDGRVKVVDFGLARATHSSATMTGGLKGKLRYMPPEQLRSEQLDRRVDVFALGAILWELALGMPLYPGPTEADIFQQALFSPQPHPDELVKGLPRAFVDVLLRAVAREPQRRFQTAEELARAAAAFAPSDAPALLSQRLGRLLGKAPRSGAEANELVVPVDLTRAQTGSIETLSESIVPPEVGARAPPPPPAPVYTPQEARRAPPLSPMPRVAKGQAQKRKPSRARPSEEAPLRPALPRAPILRAVTSTFVRQWRRREWLKWGTIAGVAALSGATIVLMMTLQASSSTAVTPGVTVEGEDRVIAQHAAPASAVDVATAAARDAEKEARRAAASARRGKGTLILKSSAPALVKLGSRELGMTPLTVELSAGRHALELRSVDGTRGAKLQVQLPKGGVVRRQVELEPL